MQEKKEFLTVSEAVQLTGKSEKTIRFLIKELLEVQSQTSSQSPEILIEVKGEKQRQFYKISLDYIQKRFFDSSRSLNETSISTSSIISVSREEVDLLHDWLDDKEKTIKLLALELEEKNKQLEKYLHLLENQQKMTMYSQVQLEKNLLLLEENNKNRKKILGLF